MIFVAIDNPITWATDCQWQNVSGAHHVDLVLASTSLLIYCDFTANFNTF
jgi:hypothetical protein